MLRALVAFGIAVLVGVSAAGATSPGRAGRIAYMLKDAAGTGRSGSRALDLSGAKRLTSGAYDSGWPVWSPDGKTIAFDSARTDRTPKDSRHVNDVFLMKADGSGVKRLTDSKGTSGDAAWSPKGSLIAFEADRGNAKELSAIYVMSTSGGKLRRITRPVPPMSDYKPRFSPDGTRLAFVRARGTAERAPAALFTVRLDGTGLRRLTSFSLHADDSDWAPDGKRIVFEAYPNPGGVRRHLRRRRERRPAGQCDSEPRWSGRLRRSSLVAGRTQDPLPRQSSREWRRANRACNDEARRL